jgi:hypothetical protein
VDVERGFNLDRKESWFDTALVCKNGHVITSILKISPQTYEKFCKECGAETLSQCPSCQADIRGDYHVPGVMGLFEYHAPKYCHACGSAYPWTATRLQVLKEIANQTAELSAKEREELSKSIDELVKDTPRTEWAAREFKRLIKKVPAETWETMKPILVQVVVDAAKKHLGL